MPPQELIDDPTLGRLRRTRLVEGCRDLYEGSVDFNGVSVKLTLTSDDRRDPTPTLARARELVARLAELVESATAFAAGTHVAEYNGIWRTDGDDALTDRAFHDACTPTDLHVDDRGEATLWFDVGDLFGGHFLEVVADPAGRFVSTDLLG